MSDFLPQHSPQATFTRDTPSVPVSAGFMRPRTRKHAPQSRAWVLAIAIAPFAPAQAHDIWLTTVAQGQPSKAGPRIGLLIGEHGQPPEALPFNPARVERMWLTTSRGVQEIAVMGPEVTLAAAGHGSGARTVAYIGKPAASILPPAEFDDYLREERLQSILVQRQQSADLATTPAATSKVSERFSRSLKLILTDPGQALVDCPVGLPLELSVVSADADELVVKATFRGQPLAGAWVDRSAADGSVLAEGVTDVDGRVALARSEGDWVVKATHMLADEEAAADWRSWWATTTFRLTAAGVNGCVKPAS